MQENQHQIISSNILKNLIDKNDDKRNDACKALEIKIKKIANVKNEYEIQKIITFFQQKYIKSSDVIKKKSGHQALYHIIIGLKTNPDMLDAFLSKTVDIFLATLSDPEPRVRYSAQKSLYFITQKLQQKVLKVFNKIFEHNIDIMADQQQQTRNAAMFLNTSLQSSLASTLQKTEQNIDELNIKQLIGIIKKKFKMPNIVIRQQLIRWINLLNQKDNINLLQYLPDILQDLLFMLGDKEKNIKLSIEECLTNFIKEIHEKFFQGKLELIFNQQTINEILEIVIKMLKNKSHLNYLNSTVITSLNFVKQFIFFFKYQLDSKCKIPNNKSYFKKVVLQRFDQILQLILLLMSEDDDQVKKLSLEVNQMLTAAIKMINHEQPINFQKVMPLLKNMLSQKKSNFTSESAMKWLKFLLQNHNDKIETQLNDIIQKLVEKLCDPCGKNVIQIIEKASVTQKFFDSLISKMLIALLKPKNQVNEKPEQILKSFSSILQPDKFCKTLALQAIKISPKCSIFIFTIMQCLSKLIVTQKNMLKVRKKLLNKNDTQFFNIMFQAFMFNPSALTCLCLLSQQYELAYKIVSTLGNQVEMNKQILTGFCKVASMIESPGFLFLRLQMLNLKEYPYLIQTLCAILMIIPQGKIANILKSRIEISKVTMNSVALKKQNKISINDKNSMEHNNQNIDVDVNKLLKEYLQCQCNFSISLK